MLPYRYRYPAGRSNGELPTSLSIRATIPITALKDHLLAESGQDALFATQVCRPPTPPTDVTATSTFPLPQPGLFSSTAIPTPQHEHTTDITSCSFKQTLDLPPETDLIFPNAPAPRVARNLHLPSFNASAIASIDLDGFPGLSNPFAAPLGIGSPLSSDPVHTRQQPMSGPFSVQPPATTNSSPPYGPSHLLPGHRAVSTFVAVQTPPDDIGVIDWTSSNANVTANMEGEQAEISQRVGFGPSETVGDDSENAETSINYPHSSGRILWLSDALHEILDIVDQNNRSDSIKILSHALPSPSTAGHAFPTIIDAIQQATASSSIMWMNVWHAVSGRFKFEDLPKSPPTTPAPPFEGDDYFTTRVFDYAVEIPDYSLRLASKPLTPTQRPAPAIAPCSIDVSIVERYIPPTSTAEFDELFSATGRSFLNDRLIELSPKHGTLLFIYPTRAGGSSFKRDYLDPILDPTLRSMMISHGLHVNLVQDVATMSAIKQLPSFEEMEMRIKSFLNMLNNSGSPHDRYHHQSAEYSVTYAQEKEVQVDRTVWAEEWWSKQEKLRVQRAFENHDFQSATMTRQSQAREASVHLATAYRETQQAAREDESKLLQRAQTQSLLRDAERSRGQKQPGDNEQMILQLMKDIATRPYKNGSPTKGIEVGVFVIQKTYRTKASIPE